MSENKRNLKQESIRSTFQKIEKIHPHKMLLYLFIFGSTLIFAFMLVAYTLTLPNLAEFYNFKFPKAFIISVLAMLVSSFMMSGVFSSFEAENLKKVRNALIITFILGIVFAVCQYIGWQQLKEEGIFFTGKASGTYLYVITGLHLVHFISAIIFLTIILAEVYKAQKDPVKVLIMVTNPYEKIKLQILNTYWQYLDILWIVLFFYFLYSF
ncbi:MAG: cytochrome c oxidase subunit 3 [Candidatus Cyclobacteriaceae bacterium M3_2C_046]